MTHTTDLATLTADTKLLAERIQAAIPVTSWQHINERTALPPLPELERLLLQAERTLTPCGREAATTVATMLLGCYPSVKAHNPDAYVRGVVSVLQDLPLDIAWQTVDVVTRNIRFLPTRSELHQTAQDLLKPRRAMCDLLRAARREAQRRATQPPKPAPTPVDPQTAAEQFSEIKRIIASVARAMKDENPS